MKSAISSLHSLIRESLNKKIIEITKKNLKGKVVHFDSDSTCLMYQQEIGIIRDNSGTIQVNNVIFYSKGVVIYYYKINGNVNELMIEKYIRNFLLKYFNVYVENIETIKQLRNRY